MSKRSERTEGPGSASADTKPKEGRGFGRFGLGRGTAEGADQAAGNASSNASSNGAAAKDSAEAAAKASAGTSTSTATKPAEVVAAPAVSDGGAPSKSAPVNASAKTVPAPASGDRVGAKAPSAAPSSKAPSAAPSAAPSSARADKPADKPTPAASDAPIPKSKLGRTKGTATGGAPRVRRARLKIANIDPWSVMKVSFLFSVALGVILLVAVTLLWLLLDMMGFFSTVASTVEDISGDEGSSGFDVVGFFSLPRVLGGATIVALIDIVMITALATLAAYLYNISTDMVGGVEVTLAEEE